MSTDNENKRGVRLPLWLEDAWHGWIKSVSGLVLIAVAYLGYRFDLLGEGLAGALLVLLIHGVALASAWPAYALARRPMHRALYFALLVAWASAVLYPSLRAASPPAAAAEAHLTGAQLTVKLRTELSPPYELSVTGGFKDRGASDKEIDYELAVRGGGEQTVRGALERKLFRTRASRRGGVATSVSEHNEQVHRLDKVAGPELAISTPELDGNLADGLYLAIRPAPPDPRMFLVLGVAALLLALYLDARVYDPRSRTRSYLLPASATSVVFMIAYPNEATPHAAVRPAVSALILSLAIGAIGGGAVAFLARAMFGPRAPASNKGR